MVDLAVRNIFELEREMGPLLATLGARHFAKHRAHFHASLLPAFSGGIRAFVLKELEEVEWSELAAAWTLLGDYLCAQIRVGFETQRKTSLRQQRSVD